MEFDFKSWLKIAVYDTLAMEVENFTLCETAQQCCPHFTNINT